MEWTTELETQVKDALKKAGLNEDHFSKVKDSIKKKEDIATEVEKFVKAQKEIPTSFDELLKNPALKAEYEKRQKAEADRRVTEAIKTHDEKVKKQAEEDADKKKKEDEDKDKTAEQLKFEELTGKVEKLTDSLTKMQGNLTNEAVTTLKRQHLKDAGLDEEKDIQFITGTTDEDVKIQVIALKDRQDILRQAQIDELVKDNKLPENSIGASTLGEDTAKGYAHELNKIREKEAEKDEFKSVV